MAPPLCSISIMACEARAAYVPGLQAELNGAPVAWDPRGHRRRGESVWEVRRLALELRDPGSRFHLVVQDDAVVGDNFHDRLAALLTDEDMAYCLYYRPKRPSIHADLNEAGRKGKDRGGFTFPKMMWGVGMVLPSWLIADCIEACERMDIRQDDVRIRAFLRDQGVQTFYPLPSLISHRTELSGRNGPNRGREARWFE